MHDTSLRFAAPVHSSPMAAADLKNLPFTLGRLRAAYADGLSPRSVIEEVLRRIEAADDPAIFLHLIDRATLFAAADGLGDHDPDNPLWGVPFAIKDNIDLAGAPTTAGCEAFSYLPGQDAFVVARLRQAGALAIGKTNLDQFATGLVGTRTQGAPPRNAIDPALVPGGSSSGSAVAVARGLVAFALGTDTAGSGRVPAALNNIVGLKPSLGTLSASGVVPACRTLDTVSIFAGTIADAHQVFQAARGFDPADPYSRDVDVAPFSARPPEFRIGIPDAASIAFFGDTIQAAIFARDVAALEAAGARITPIDFSAFFAVGDLLYEGAWVAERHTVIEDLLRRDPDAIHPVTRRVIAKAETMSAADAFRGLYRLAELKRATGPALRSVDALCVPTIPTLCTMAELDTDPVAPNSRLGTYTNFVNLLDLCGIAVPTDAGPEGRPGSVTLLAPAGRDGYLAGLAGLFEEDANRTIGATDWSVEAEKVSCEAAPDEMEITVCGAHMAGLPLNAELTSRGGRFLREAETAASYRFYALAGGPPERPGLVYRGSGKGERIGLEIWSLPKTSLGDFIGGIPFPLGIGSVELSNGAHAKGFVCDASAAETARDITGFGNWRDYLASLE